MKLYFSPGTCSLSPHIILNELGFNYELVKVDLKSHKTEKGNDYFEISPTGMVPVLELDDGSHLLEGPAIVQFLADQKPEKGLAPKNGTVERVHLQSWLNWISAELHKGHLPIFASDKFGGEQAKQGGIKNLKTKYDYVEKQLGNKEYLMGNTFTVADAYLYTILNWHKSINLDLADWPNLKKYFQRVESRPAVKAALEKEASARKKVA